MASASSLAANAKVSGDEPPPLICAPCYICLEDGPDEKGQPLIRACSCRGESSAGYHLSCVINYAKAKTKEAVEKYEADDDDWGYFDDHWLECVNCKQGYEESLCVELANEMVAYVATLVSDPETHYLHYWARKVLLRHLSSITEHASAAQEGTISLLRIWEEQKSDMYRRWEGREDVDERDQTICHMDQKDELLMLLASAQLKQGKNEQGIETLEESLKMKRILKTLIGDNKNNSNDGGGEVEDEDDDIDSKIKDIERLIQNLKGSTTSKEKEDQLRQDIAKFAAKNDQRNVNVFKKILGSNLLKREPPEYEEAIRLLEEASEGLERILGPSHKDVADAKHKLAGAKLNSDLERRIEEMGGSKREDELHKDITKFANENDHRRASIFKCYLASKMLKKDPPEYDEAVSLFEEACEDLKRALGPNHKDVAEVSNCLAKLKKMDEERHLASNDTSNGHHAGDKRKRDGEN